MASPRPAQRAPFGATVALAVTLAVAGFGVVMPLLLTAIEPVSLGAAFPAQNQTAETLAYLLAYGLLLPLALVAARRVADALAAGPNGAALPALAAGSAGTLAAAVIGLRAAGRYELADGVIPVLAAAAAWWLCAAAVVARALRPRPWPALLALAPHAVPLWAGAAATGFVALLCFAQLGSISLPVLAAGGLAGAAVAAAHGRVHARRLPRPWGIAADVALLAGLMALVPDLVIFRPEQAPGDLATGVETGIVQFHHDFLLGPAREVLDGRPMLVGTASQYGVTSIYLLAGWFQLAPIGYGTLGLLAGVLTALWFGAGYSVLRLAGTARPLAAAALGIGIVALAYNLTYPVGALPQSGPLRFGLPMLVVLGAVVGARRPACAGLARAAGLAAVGLSSVWSLEAFAYSAATWVALEAWEAWLRPEPDRLRAFGRRALGAAAACAIAHAVFAGTTLGASGELPDWGEYLVYLREFLFGEIGDLTYDVARWTPALPVGAGYLASVAALAELARRRGPVLERERPALVALTGLTAYGIVLLGYYVDRSLDHILMHVALPAVLVAALWLSVLLRAGPGVARGARASGLAAAAAAAALIVAVAWSSVADRLPRTPLAHAAPGGRSLGGALDRLWHPPPLDPRSPAGERLVARHMPGTGPVLVMTAPDVGTEILLRSGRADALALGYAWEASFVAHDELPRLRGAVDDIPPGTRMLMDAPARAALATLRSDPSFDPLERAIGALAPLQVWALDRLRDRYELRGLAGAEAGFTVVELRPRA
jgi:hypothetical protein